MATSKYPTCGRVKIPARRPFETIPQSILKILDEISDPSILGLLHRKALKAKSLEDFRQIVDLMMEEANLLSRNL